MAYSALFLLLGLAQIAIAASHGGWAWLTAWPGISFIAVGAAHAGIGPSIFGKRPDGTLAIPNVILLLPFLLFAWATWHAQRLCSRGPAAQEIVTGVWLGRRVLPSEAPAGVTLIVDLAAEFPELPSVIQEREYISLPTLDTRAPDVSPFVAALNRAAASSGPILVHCANGSGRSAAFVAALLIRLGHCADTAEAEQFLRAIRPQVRLYPEQKRLIHAVCEGFGDYQS
jgi:hypothetical protein